MTRHGLQTISMALNHWWLMGMVPVRYIYVKHEMMTMKLDNILLFMFCVAGLETSFKKSVKRSHYPPLRFFIVLFCL